MKTRNGKEVEIVNYHKQGLSVFFVFGYVDGKPCHWTRDGKYRMDDKEHELDIIDYERKE